MATGDHHNPHDRIQIGRRVVSRILSEIDPRAWTQMLDSVRLSGSGAQCLCNGPAAPLAMYVARHGNTLVLKRAPGTGPQHHRLCPSHGVPSASGSTGESAASMEQLAGGLVRVCLDAPLRRLQAPTAARGSLSTPSQSPASGRSTLTLLGLLEFLWERAGLHRWNPDAGPRRLGAVYAKLQEEAGEVLLGTTPAEDAVYIPDTHLDPGAMQRKAADLNARFDRLRQQHCLPGEDPLVLLIGEVRSLFDTRYGAGMRLKGLPDACTVWLSAELSEQLQRRFPGPIKRFVEQAADVQTRLWCITSVMRSAKGQLNAASAALLEATGEFIPVDSGHEARLAHDLVQAQRRFTKPLRASSADDVHPDFVLHDAVGGDWVMEVWGMDTAEYRLRKQAKLATYRERGVRLWQWDATRATAIPPLPVRQCPQIR